MMPFVVRTLAGLLAIALVLRSIRRRGAGDMAGSDRSLTQALLCNILVQLI